MKLPTSLWLKNYNPKLYKRLVELGCEFQMIKELDPKEIYVDQGIYPRSSTDTDRVEMYKEDVLKGDTFPPVIITKKGEKYLLIDGNHRYFAHLNAGVSIAAEVWKIPSHQVRYVATICNVLGRGKAGKDLTGSEKKKGIIYAFSEGINTDINKLAEDFETTVSYVRKVLSQAGLIRDRKEEMKKRAKELRDEGLSYREIAKRLEEEFGEKVAIGTLNNWLCSNFYPGKELNKEKCADNYLSNELHTPTVRSTLDDPERLVQEEEEELLAVDAVAEEADRELSLKEKIEEAKRLIREEGIVPAEAYKRAGLPEEWEKKYKVLRELLEVWESTEAGRRRIKEELSGLKTEDKPKKKEVNLKSKEELYKEIVDTINLQLRRWQQIEGEEGVIRLLEGLLEMYKSGRYKNNPSWRRANGVYLAEFRRI